MDHPSRRGLLTASAAALGALALPRAARASAADRRFLFITCAGGWDPTTVFAAGLGSDWIDYEEGVQTGTAGDLTFVDHPDRPAVATFFRDNAHRATLIHGIELRSVSHFVCRRLLCTGAPSPGRDDWAALLGARARTSPVLPTLVISGLSYAAQAAASVVRVGQDGQLADLIHEVARQRSDTPVTLPSAAAQAAVDRYAAAQAAIAAAQPGVAGQLGAEAVAAAARLAAAKAAGDRIDLGATATLADRLALATEALAQGLCRCAVVGYDGVLNQGWDTHANLWLQGLHFEELFGALSTLLVDMDSRVGPAGGLLSEEVVIVLLSEMGRFPQRNAGGGKDHWTYTSALLVGPGLRPGLVGAYTDHLIGQPVALSTGQPDATGTPLQAGHLGATLLALGDVDPAEFLAEAPIEGALA